MHPILSRIFYQGHTFGPDILLLFPTFHQLPLTPDFSQHLVDMKSTFQSAVLALFSTVKYSQRGSLRQRSWHSGTLRTRLGVRPGMSPPA